MKINLKKTHKTQLQNAVKNLNRIINAIREYIPEANIFFENGETLTIHNTGEIKPYESYSLSQIFDAGNVNYCDGGGY
jgi:hypothetical protein